MTASFNLNVSIDNEYKILPINDVDLFIRAPTAKLKQQECVKTKGLWNHDDDTCYKYYVYYCLLDSSPNMYYYRS